MKKIIGIYKILNPNGCIYIGQSANIKERFRCYKYLKCKKQIKLYNSLKKYGWENHIIEVIEECLIEELDNKEIHYIKLYNTFNTKNGLNLQSGGNRPIASDETRAKLKMNCGKHMIGKHHSEETKQKISKGNIGKKISDESKKKMSTAQKARMMCGEKNNFYGEKHSKESKQKMSIATINCSDETRKKLSIAQKGKILTQEHKERISKSLKGKLEGDKNPMFGKKGELSPNFGLKRSEETRKKLRIARSKMTDETKEKIRNTLKQKYINKEITNPNLGVKMSDEQRKKLSDLKRITKEERLMMIF